MKYQEIREEELKNKVAKDIFWLHDCSKILGNIDFCVCLHHSANELRVQESLLWAEAKVGSSDIYQSLTQLVLTIGNSKTLDKFLPPPFLGAFDGEKIAFIPYNEIYEVFYINDFNWNVAPSNYKTKEFLLILNNVKTIIEKNALLFNFQKNEKELNEFIKNNFIVGKFGITKTKVNKNNFMVVYNKWLQDVKPSIAVNWELAKKNGIIDGDFYIADLLSRENDTLKEKLFVLLNKDHYELDRWMDTSGMFNSKRTEFKDKQVAHSQFWNRYDRPPQEEYWDYIVERRDLLVPQDIRERRGSFFTPQIWVELSQKYLTDTLGENWQDEYYIWDCAAGTGNLLNGLTNKYNIYASTIDKQDIEVIHDRIANGANLLDTHVFQFDFLNDDFSKLPKSLFEIINDPIKRKKLVIYINPPYAEASDKKTLLGGLEGKGGVEQSTTNKKYSTLLGQANAELFAQFFIRIYMEIPDCILAEFSTLKIIQGQHFIDFRNHFLAKLVRLFLVPADTFDNVKGKFPIGFFIWLTSKKENFKKINADVYERNGLKIFEKTIESQLNNQYINDWIKPFRGIKLENGFIGKFPFKGNDFQNQNMIAIVNPNRDYNKEAGQFLITFNNLLYASIYFAVRHCIKASWLNDRDQFLFPNKKWAKDMEFQNDCIVFTLFKNIIQSKYGTNHWIPFTEDEVNAKEKFESNSMSNYLNGRPVSYLNENLFISNIKNTKPLAFSQQAKEVLNVGRKLFTYYHQQPNINVNASLYDIKEYFKGRNESGKINSKSQDDIYTSLINELNEGLVLLALKIEPKVYEFCFLKK